MGGGHGQKTIFDVSRRQDLQIANFPGNGMTALALVEDGQLFGVARGVSTVNGQQTLVSNT